MKPLIVAGLMLLSASVEAGGILGGDYWTAVAADRQMRAHRASTPAREENDEERARAAMRSSLERERARLKTQILEHVSHGGEAPAYLEDRLRNVDQALH